MCPDTSEDISRIVAWTMYVIDWTRNMAPEHLNTLLNDINKMSRNFAYVFEPINGVGAIQFYLKIRQRGRIWIDFLTELKKDIPLTITKETADPLLGPSTKKESSTLILIIPITRGTHEMITGWRFRSGTRIVVGLE